MIDVRFTIQWKSASRIFYCSEVLSNTTAVVEALNQKLEVAHNTLRFHIDDTTEEIKVQVVDKETGKVVRTIPPEPSLSILAQGEFSSLLSVQG